MGALLGKTTFSQLMVVVTIEAIFYSLNRVICVDLLKIHDLSGSMMISEFGACFGLAASIFFNPKKAKEDKFKQNEGDYFSNLTAFVGSIFLFMYWPSFNSVLANGLAQQRSSVNTLASISGSLLIAAYVSRLVKRKIDAETILHAAFAGGVCMGASSDLITNPGFAMLTGAIIGGITAIGFLFGNHWCRETFNLHDTCGVLWSHGLPGVYGGFVSAVCAGATYYNFGSATQVQLLVDVSRTPK